ncbi:hypothetical protein TNCV_1443161 [Trichonephila clavipes]|nr:hypothetical protein TNCV_1443161 [Trichonephila clavipes]
MFYSHCSKAKNAVLDSLENCTQPDSLEFCVQECLEKMILMKGGINSAKRREIFGIEASSRHFTSFEGTRDAFVMKSFPGHPKTRDNSQHRVLRSEVELVYKSDDDVLFSRTEIGCIIYHLSLNKSRVVPTAQACDI